jgi:predicted Zn-dependent protease
VSEEFSVSLVTGSGQGAFFDGVTSARQSVVVELTAAALRIRGPDGGLLAEWPYAELQSHAAPVKVLRLGRPDGAQLARLEIRDPALAAQIEQQAPSLDRGGLRARRSRAKVVAWSTAAMLSLVVTAVFAVPQIAAQVAPLVPQSLERRLGAAVEAQVRSMLDANEAGEAFECGHKDVERAGVAALAKMVHQLEEAAALPQPLHVIPVHRSEANAFALPGGNIYLLEGLIAKARSPDELAAVLAHEIGHVAHRDGTRSVLQAAGLSVLFGMLLGDFVGGGAVVLAAKTVLQSSYSREVEGAADRYGVELMNRAGGDVRALGAVLTRIAGAIHPGMEILRDHPDTKARVAVINTLAASSSPPQPLLEPSEWAALKRICTGR